MDLKELESGVNPDTHWYYQSKKLPLFTYIKKVLKKTDKITIIDVGSGSGFFAHLVEKQFKDRIEKVYLVDIGYTETELEQTRNQKLQKVLQIPDKIENGVIIMMDVLEHLEDDLAMLQSIKKNSTGDNNYFFITVPAFNSLWSGHDDYLGHYRRYKIRTLTKVLREANFTTTNSYYLYGSLFPMVWAVRKIGNLKKKAAESNMKPFSPIANSLLYRLSASEMRIAGINKVFGVTCVAEGKI